MSGNTVQGFMEHIIPISRIARANVDVFRCCFDISFNKFEQDRESSLALCIDPLPFTWGIF